jgi:fructokinase
MADVEGSLFGAIELGGSKVLCAIASRTRVLSEIRLPTRAPEPTLRAIEDFFLPHRSRLTGLGIAAFGPLELAPGSPGFGSLLATPKPGWSGVSLATRLQDKLGVPVAIDTDVNAAALAEHRVAGDDPCVYLTVGTGIGVGVCVGGSGLHGLLHPELGHLPAPALCDFVGACPFHGRCIEGVASAYALSQRTGSPADQLPDAHPVWALEAQYLAHLLAACVLAYAPRRIVVGGGVLARVGLLDKIRAQLVAVLAGYVPRVELSQAGIANYVRAPTFGQRSGLMGAWLLAQQARVDH